MQYVTAEGLPPVSKIGLGTMRFGEKTFAPDLARALVRRALELGITHFDTAEAYGWGRSERLLGEALTAEGATDVVVTSKYSPLLPLPALIERRARASRSRLALPQIPLYLLHMPNPLVPRRVIMSGFGRARKAGVIGAAGVSNHSLGQWQAAEAALGHPVVANQILFNLLHRGPLGDLVPWAAGHRRLVIAASPLGQGILAGRYDHDHPPVGLPWPRRLAMRHSALPPTPANLRRLAPLLEQLRAVAARHDATPAAIALAWAISHNPVVVIPGASSISQLEANAAAADITLTQEEQQALTSAASPQGLLLRLRRDWLRLAPRQAGDRDAGQAERTAQVGQWPGNLVQEQPGQQYHDRRYQVNGGGQPSGRAARQRERPGGEGQGGGEHAQVEHAQAGVRRRRGKLPHELAGERQRDGRADQAAERGDLQRRGVPECGLLADLGGGGTGRRQQAQQYAHQ